MRYPTDEGGFYELNSFPGCNQLVISNHAWIPPKERGKGLGDANHKKRLAKIKELGYDYAICTVIGTNKHQLRILDKNGWSPLAAFVNKETGNLVQIWGKNIG